MGSSVVSSYEFLQSCKLHLISKGDFEMNTLDLQSRALNKHDLPMTNSVQGRVGASQNRPIDLTDL